MSFWRVLSRPFSRRRSARAQSRVLPLAERVAFNAAAQLVSQIVLAAGGLVAVAVTTRYLDVRDYGALVTALIFVSLFVMLTDFGLTTIGGREVAKSPEDAQRILSSLGLMATVISLLAFGAAIGIAQIAYAGPENAEVRKAINVLLPQLLVMGPRSAAIGYLVSRQKMYFVSFAGVATRVVTLALVIAVVIADLGFVAMVATYAAFPILGAVVTILFARTGVPRPRWWDRSLGLKLLKLSLPLGGVLIANFLYFRLDLFLLSLLATERDVALYGVAYKVIEVLILVPSYIMITLLPTMAIAEASSERLNRLVQNAFSAMQVIAVPLVALSFYSAEILDFIAGDQYTAADTALQLLMIGLALSFLQQVFGYTLISQNRQGRALLALLAVLFLNLGLNLVLIPLFKINGAAIALVVSEAASLVAIAFVYSRIGTLPSLHAPVKILLAGLVMVGLALGTRNGFGPLLGSPGATLIVGGTVSFAGYVLALRQLDAIPPAASTAIGNLIRRRSPA